MHNLNQTSKFATAAIRGAACIVLVNTLLAGCASNQPAIADEGRIIDEITVTSPMAEPKRIRRHHKVRRIAGAAQATILYGRSIYVDPITRPVSSTLSLTSFAVKSTLGFFRRLIINTVQQPALENTPIPELSNAEGMDLVQWEKDLDKIVGHKSSKGKIDFLIDGEQYFTRLLETIAAAEESIDIRTYIFDNDDFAVEIADVLKEKSKTVRVRIQLDALGNLMATQSDPKTLPAGYRGPLSISRYLRKGSRVKVRSRANPGLRIGDHTKTTIIDKKTAFVGGMNIGREYRYEWHDLMMEVTGPIVDQLQYDSDKAWARASVFGDVANFLRILGGKRKHAGSEGYAIRTLYTRNFDAQIYRAQLAAIRRARSYIIIENAYFSDDLITYELAKARRRGVDVRVIMPAEGNHKSLNASNQVAINTLLDNGIRVFQYRGMSHIKAAVFDGWICVGSANFDKLSLEVNKELNLATSHPETVNRLMDELFLPDLAMSQEITEPVVITFAQRMTERAVDELL
ncbi:MAG: phosphatidylserine/phosphatidylglycerophosphate/cardiolipin synthase family protein [Proteobacteria bacterium]|nr:phosphatidylserine/phosphatidylglycerophosphate/cardiolipin synthase family protein [Pseudomonadota bacterium]